MIDSKLKTYVEVIETKSYTKAAQRLHLTQPAVTQHIKQLESYYQQTLILHPHKEFLLTKAGQALYEYAKIQLHNEALFESHIRAISLPIVLGSTLSIADYYLSDILCPFLFQSDQKCKVVVNNTSALIHSMIEGTVDCAFIEGKFDPELFDFHLFQEESFLPVVRKGHPLAKQTITLPAIFSYPLLLREQGSGTRAIFEAHLLQSMYSLDSFHQIIEIESMAMIKQMLSRSDGITFLYQQVVRDEWQQGSIVPLFIPGFPMKHEMYFIYLKSNLDKDIYEALFQTMMRSSNR